ncbi:MAG: hypothetical protein M1838_001525 [Thelocarpon superellum]|nr:MAG: hypothetical protein M1838_001525 [Thelocarpon superellum]
MLDLDGGPSHYSLRDEAQNTGRSQSFWASDTKLRHNKVAFVSAGAMDPKVIEPLTNNPAPPAVTDSEMALAGLKLDDKGPLAEPDPPALVGETACLDAPRVIGESTTPQFIIDVEPSQVPLETSFPPPSVRRLSASPSDSSEDVVLFAGRKGLNGKFNEKNPSPLASRRSTPNQSRTANEDIDLKVQNLPQRSGGSSSVSTQALSPPREAAKSTDLIEITVMETARLSRDVPLPTGSMDPSHRTGGSDAILADYIANMRESGAMDDFLPGQQANQRDLGPSPSGTDMVPSALPEPHLHKNYDRWNWDASAINDFDDLSTSTEAIEAVGAILSKRARSSGLQYLVVLAGDVIDNARWISAASLSMPGATEVIRQFEDDERLLAEYAGGSEEISDDGKSVSSDAESGPAQGEGKLDDEDEDVLDEADLLQRKVERMTDERIARLLAKQEELGMGSEELLLFDDDDEAEADPGKGPSKSKMTHRRPSRSSKKSKATRPMADFPSATFLADAYDNFDVMDWERSSVQITPRGKKKALPFQVSDSELEAQLISSWTKDRKKKSAQKQEREELRAQGLLGKKNNNQPKLQAKYDEGMTLEDIKDEIREFLLSTKQSLALPPMDKKDRKIVHEIANAFNLKSKSTGAGRGRFPTLLKTARSAKYDENAIGDLDARLRQRRFFPRMDKTGRKGLAVPNRNGGGRNAAVSYRDGEVVGAAAPELGVDNRGRAMLEKMGWSTGTALGALDNKGILQPVTHVVKISKAGLG